MTTEYREGDATKPDGPGPHFIVHVCNDAGTWGAGFVTAVSKRWKEPAKNYQEWSKSLKGAPLPLGICQWVRVEEDVWVVNMIAQNNFGRGRWGQRPLRYAALTKCLAELVEPAVKAGATVHMPRIGCGIAGGHWNQVGALVDEILARVPVIVYDYNPPKPKFKGKGRWAGKTVSTVDVSGSPLAGEQLALPAAEDWTPTDKSDVVFTEPEDDPAWAGWDALDDGEELDAWLARADARDAEDEAEGGLYGAGAYGSYVHAATEQDGPRGKPVIAKLRIVADIEVEVSEGEWNDAVASGEAGAVANLLNKRTGYLLSEPEVYGWDAVAPDGTAADGGGVEVPAKP